MRWVTLVIFLFIILVITTEMMAVIKLYRKLLTSLHYKNLTNMDKRNAVAMLRFDSYLRDFNRTYKNKEYERRFRHFKASLKEIARLNKLENNTVFGLTKFSDMSKEEFADRMLAKSVTDINGCQPIGLRSCTDAKTDNDQLINKKYVGKIPPGSFDWRKKGVVKPVLNQKGCKGCWAFSIVGVLESMSAIQFDDHRSRSIQELLDCSTVNNGCYNGSVSIAMGFICNAKMKFVTEEKYPMTLSMEKDCQVKNFEINYTGRRVQQYQHICKMNENEMVKSIAFHGPLIVAVSSKNWQNYLGGIITRACTRGVADHVVQVVGYEGYRADDEGYRRPDAEAPTPYYIVRNSYGEDWGDEGYVKIAMKHGDISNVCGIAEQVTIIDALRDPS